MSANRAVRLGDRRRWTVGLLVVIVLVAVIVVGLAATAQGLTHPGPFQCNLKTTCPSLAFYTQSQAGCAKDNGGIQGGQLKDPVNAVWWHSVRGVPGVLSQATDAQVTSRLSSWAGMPGQAMTDPQWLNATGLGCERENEDQGTSSSYAPVDRFHVRLYPVLQSNHLGRYMAGDAHHDTEELNPFASCFPFHYTNSTGFNDGRDYIVNHWFKHQTVVWSQWRNTIAIEQCGGDELPAASDGWTAFLGVGS